ncbi:MAG TPA: amino acid ABC transporter permease [Chthoniobacterales bacterium]
MKRIFLDQRENPAPPAWQALHLAALLLLFSLISWALLARTDLKWEAVWKYRGVFFSGWLLTIGLSFAALLLSLLIGAASALASRSSFLPLRSLAVLYVELVRGTPLLAQIFWFTYVVFGTLPVDRLFVGVLSLACFTGAYISEILRAGIQSIGESQLESARAIGFTPLQTYRFVIFPQALRQALPPLAGQFASLIKDSSLLSVIGISEFTLAAQQSASATYTTLESYLPLALGYLALTVPIFLFTRWLERRSHFLT